MNGLNSGWYLANKQNKIIHNGREEIMNYKTSIPAFGYSFATKQERTKTRYDYIDQIEETLDDALNNLSPKEFEGLKDDINILMAEYED